MNKNMHSHEHVAQRIEGSAEPRHSQKYHMHYMSIHIVLKRYMRHRNEIQDFVTKEFDRALLIEIF